MQRAERWRLERPESLDLYLTWRSMGTQPPTLGELLELPGWLVRDFQRLTARWNKAKKRKEHQEESGGNDVSTSARSPKPKRR